MLNSCRCVISRGPARNVITACSLVFLLLGVWIAPANSAENRRAKATRSGAPAALLPAARKTASPDRGELVSVNPPPLVWPPAQGKEVRYLIRLSQDRNFPQASTLGADGLPWAMFNAHQKLAEATWYWQYGTLPKAGAAPSWSDVFHFQIDSSARPFVTPPAKEMLASCQASHPRVLIAADRLKAFRQRWAKSPAAADYARHAERYLERPLPDPSEAKTSKKGKNDYETKNFAKWASKAYAADVLEAIEWLVPAYLITGDERFGRQAARYGVFTASLDPNGDTAPNVSDFADGSCMRAMALSYDACYSLLSDAERAKMRESMAARGNRFFGRIINKLEAQLWNAHTWQHILLEATELALATAGELPEANQWLAYAYELWVSRFPRAGGDDGGWAEGIGYMGSNLDTLLAMPELWGRLTGVDFFDGPWYRSAPYFHLYAWPPGSVSDGFGDGTERGDRPSNVRGYFLRVLGERTGNPYALWYASELKAIDDGVIGGSLLAWRRLVLPEIENPPAPKSPRDLPQSRAFRDVGIVSMHTDMADASNDLMLGFRSSPYGAYNHAHACQNAFNLNLGGKRLFANSGYYIGYGDDHFRGWYTQTRGHNSVLIDDKGQISGTEGYGWIARFLDGRQISYTVGDASHAYGDAGLTRFRRHLVLLRPSTVVIYDDLAADHPAGWSWLLHSPKKLTANGQRILGAVAKGRGQVDLLGSTPLAISVSTKFDPPALNWRDKKDAGKTAQYPDQWHATVKPDQKADRMRFLAVIQLRLPSDNAPMDSPAMDGQGRLRVGPWSIQAELNASHDASLLIERLDGKAALAADRETMAVAGKQYDAPADGAVLVETEGDLVRTCRDEMPLPR